MAIRGTERDAKTPKQATTPGRRARAESTSAEAEREGHDSTLPPTCEEIAARAYEIFLARERLDRLAAGGDEADARAKRTGSPEVSPVPCWGGGAFGSRETHARPPPTTHHRGSAASGGCGRVRRASTRSGERVGAGEIGVGEQARMRGSRSGEEWRAAWPRSWNTRMGNRR